MQILEWMGKYEPIWLFLILFPEMVAGIYSAVILKKEFDYDEQKDLEKKQKRTKTTKRTSTKGGETIIEESSEVSEPMVENITKGEMK
jgi:hypothetical protein